MSMIGVHLDGHGLQPFDIEQLLLSHPRQVAVRPVIGPALAQLGIGLNNPDDFIVVAELPKGVHFC